MDFWKNRQIPRRASRFSSTQGRPKQPDFPPCSRQPG